jgi:hypothetical protein
MFFLTRALISFFSLSFSFPLSFFGRINRRQQ